jgi:hypothetical protein
VKVGDKVKLTGITRHGKNRVREQGDLWTVTAIAKARLGQSNIAAAGAKIALLQAESNPDKNWRWVEVTHDKNFHVRIMSNDIEELKIIKSENK